MHMPSTHSATCIACAFVFGLVLCACGKPQPPDRERPPEPQAQPKSQLRKAIGEPIDRARQADAEVQKAADAQRAAIDAATGH
jgi:hypothetical protein